METTEKSAKVKVEVEVKARRKSFKPVILNSLIHIRSSLRARISPFGPISDLPSPKRLRAGRDVEPGFSMTVYFGLMKMLDTNSQTFCVRI
jgi:hypothetical protein